MNEKTKKNGVVARLRNVFQRIVHTMRERLGK